MAQGTKRKGDAFAPPSQTKPNQRLVAHHAFKDVVDTTKLVVQEEHIRRQCNELVGESHKELPLVTIQLSIVVKLKPGFRVGNRTLFDGLIVNDTDAGSTTEGIVTNHLHTAWSEERKSVGIALGSTDARLKEEVGLSV